MIKFICSFLLFISCYAVAQQPYYNDVNLNLTGQDLYIELQNKISVASSSFTYGDVRDTVKITDEDPTNSDNLLLIYGYDDNDGNCTTDRSRDKDNFGGMSCEYNREHTFARGNANPSMGTVDNNTTGIGADPHNLRPSDQQMNNNKGNKKFADGSGNAGNVGSGNWYPGDEWKGDVARMMMYMYTRYGDRCLPSLNGVGTLQGSTDMLTVYLEWNAEDPVSDMEDQRNPYLETVYGNRNPFIDNPALATIIWGGPQAEDRWDSLNTNEFSASTIKVHPNPASEVINMSSTSTVLETANLFSIHGNLILTKDLQSSNQSLDISQLDPGIYLLQLETTRGNTIKKIIVE